MGDTEGSEDTRDRVGDGAGDEGQDEAARVVFRDGRDDEDRA